MQKGGHFRMSSDNISFLMKKSGHVLQKRAHGSHT